MRYCPADSVVFVLPVILAVGSIPLFSAVIRAVTTFSVFVLAVASSAFAFVVFGLVCFNASAFPSSLS
jgi:hypothetical protein